MPHTSGMSKLSALPRGTAQAKIEAINRSAADVVFNPSIRDASAVKLRRLKSLSACPCTGTWTYPPRGCPAQRARDEGKATRFAGGAPLQLSFPPLTGRGRWRTGTALEDLAMHAVGESDWIIFKRLRERALERYSQRILDQSQAICADTSLSAHARYQQLFRWLQQHDREIAAVFDDPRRSTAVLSFRQMRHLGLIMEEELAELSVGFRAQTEW